MGRFLQLMAMSLLVMSIFTAGPMGPSPRIFGTAIGVFAAGWGISKLAARRMP